ncbi:hypothetical protein CJ030_MR7G015255, partial [Morella rubra]
LSIQTRQNLLFLLLNRYVCCAGYMPCSGRCGESQCPELCLCTEGFMFCLQQLACIFSIIACLSGNDELQEASQRLNCFADLTYCTVCACLQTQHKIEMDKRDGKFEPQPMMGVPVQHMSRIDQALFSLIIDVFEGLLCSLQKDLLAILLCSLQIFPDPYMHVAAPKRSL